MMTDFVATENVWIVLSEKVELIVVEVGQQFTSSQVCEQYATENDAHVRMVELDPNWTPDDHLTVLPILELEPDVNDNV